MKRPEEMTVDERYEELQKTLIALYETDKPKSLAEWIRLHNRLEAVARLIQYTVDDLAKMYNGFVVRPNERKK